MGNQLFGWKNVAFKPLSFYRPTRIIFFVIGLILLYRFFTYYVSEFLFRPPNNNHSIFIRELCVKLILRK